MLGAYLPFFPRWLEARGISGLALGAVSAAMPAMSVVAPPAFGWLADRLQLRGSLLRIASAGALAAMGFLALAAWLGLELGFTAIALAVVAFAFFRSPMVLVADVIAVEHAEKAGASYGKLRRWGSLGFLLGSLAAGHFVVPTRAGPLPTAIAAGLALSVLAAFAVPSRGALAPRPVGREIAVLLRARRYRVFLAASLLGQLGHSAYDLCFSLHLRDLRVSDDVTGIAWAIGVGAEVVLLTVATPLFRRVSAGALVVIAFVLAAIRWALTAVVHDVRVLCALQLLHAASFGLMWMASLSVNRAASKPEIFGTAQAVMVTSMATGSTLGMLAWSALYRASGGATVFLAATGVSALAALVALPLIDRRR